MTDITESGLKESIEMIALTLLKSEDEYLLRPDSYNWKDVEQLQEFKQILQNQKDAQEYRQKYEDNNKFHKELIQGCNDEIYKLQSQYKKLVDAIQNKIKSLPIYCQICGEKLTLGSTGPNIPSWGCSYLYDDGTNVLKHKPNRGIADKHFADSRRYMTFEQVKIYEAIESELQNLLKELEKE